MADRRYPDIVDDFSELYKEYTGPPVSNATNLQDQDKTNKRFHVNSDDEEESRDPNAVPTDFTSREAKFWEAKAKAKATERNWKKKKEEEMICKICGKSGHFTRGCPSTLGANCKSRDFFERVPAREKHVKALFTEKSVDAVHKVKEEGESKDSYSSRMSRSRSPERRSPVSSWFGRSASQRCLPSPHNPFQVQQRFGRQDKVVEDRVLKDLQKLARSSPQGRHRIGSAYGNDGARSRSTHSNSPARPLYTGNSRNSYDNHNRSLGAYRTDGWDSERRGSRMQSGLNFEYPVSAQTLEELELELGM
ncbi:Alpha,alpha-trehalose-phosphate synthase [Actinidia chinensis var. chinensis]|uniref:Alpha,alpha-trehalose-phosphate synthase n=1 Tax=Actinidia chinensis var. chinensis TaxID=1590841 RepID=A0A2R6PNU0_ACTCC|nr:Alpha,alpha-trehalose-phosphate synthase [Actinidia chinensis var. chinensis]